MLEDKFPDQDQFFNRPERIAEKQRVLEALQFCFPPKQFLSFPFSSVSEIQKHLIREGRKDYKIKRRGCYFYFICCFCPAKISVCLKNNNLRIVRFRNHHVHSVKKNRRVQQSIVLELLKESPKLQNPQQTKLRILRMMPINQRRYRYILNKHFDKNWYKMVLEHFQTNNYNVKVQHKQQNQMPQLMLIMSNQMWKWANKFNNVFTFDITYHILKSRSRQNKQWGVGIFTTFNAYLNIIPVAYAIILKEDTDTIATLFKGFLQLAGTRTCTFITDQQKAVKSALHFLRQKGSYNGSHVLDDFHLLRNIRPKVGDEFVYYHKLITTKDPRQFDVVYDKLYEQSSYPSLLKNLYQNKKMTCYSQGQNKFVGLRFSTSIGQKCNDLLKTVLPRQSNLFRLVLAFQKLQLRINQRKPTFESKKYQILFQDYRILQVRESVSEKIFKVFLKNYVKGLRATAEKLENYHQVEGFRTSGSECQCGLNIKSGIPCHHMLAVLIRQTKHSYVKYFNQRWLDTHEKQKVCQYERQGPRKSRRRKN